MHNLTGKTALVTGSTGAIGGAIAKKLHKHGATVILTGTKEIVLQELTKDLNNNVAYFPCNLNDTCSIEELTSFITDNYQRIDILVNNAGITKDNLALRMSQQDFIDVMNVNLMAPFLLSKYAIKGMMKARWGRIINISSVVGTIGNPGQTNYCATKAGIVGMSKAMALEIASRNINVNCISPGFIESEMTSYINEEQKTALLNSIPQKRIGSPDDIANAALFLASEESAYITGQNIHVNGGMAMV